MSISIERIKPKNLRHVSFLMNMLFKHPYVFDDETLADLIVQGLGFVALEGLRMKVVGYILFAMVPHERTEEPVMTMLSLGVLPRLRGKGIGGELIKKFQYKYPKMKTYLHVRTPNVTAIRLYENNYYRQIMFLPKYVTDVDPPEDGVYMEADAADPNAEDEDEEDEGILGLGRGIDRDLYRYG